jgi:hypothetical protein
MLWNDKFLAHLNARDSCKSVAAYLNCESLATRSAEESDVESAPASPRGIAAV